MDTIKERKVYSPPSQGPPKLSSNLTAPSMEVPRKVSRASTMTKGTAVPIAQKSLHTKQMVDKPKQKQVDIMPTRKNYSPPGSWDESKVQVVTAEKHKILGGKPESLQGPHGQETMEDKRSLSPALWIHTR